MMPTAMRWATSCCVRRSACAAACANPTPWRVSAATSSSCCCPDRLPRRRRHRRREDPRGPRRPLHLAGLRVEVSSSIGVALYPDHGADEAALMLHADRHVRRQELRPRPGDGVLAGRLRAPVSPGAALQHALTVAYSPSRGAAARVSLNPGVSPSQWAAPGRDDDRVTGSTWNHRDEANFMGPGAGGLAQGRVAADGVRSDPATALLRLPGYHRRLSQLMVMYPQDGDPPAPVHRFGSPFTCARLPAMRATNTAALQRLWLSGSLCAGRLVSLAHGYRRVDAPPADGTTCRLSPPSATRGALYGRYSAASPS